MPGLQAWLFQRISAVYLGLYTPLLLLYFIVMPPQSYAEWHVFLASPWVNSSILLFALALLVHAWVGVRDVVLDYVHPYLLRLAIAPLGCCGDADRLGLLGIAHTCLWSPLNLRRCHVTAAPTL